MIADTVDELHDMARLIGLKRSWFQISRSGIPHYDISQSKRKLAVENGAIEIGIREFVEVSERTRILK